MKAKNSKTRLTRKEITRRLTELERCGLLPPKQKVKDAMRG